MPIKKELIFSGHGIEVYRAGETFSIRYDAGEIAVNLKEVDVSAEDASKAMRSERDAYEVLLNR